MRAAALIVAAAALAAPLSAAQPAAAPRIPAQPAAKSRTRIVLLGTGTPAATPERSGPATAIVVNDTAYLVDLGPGVVRRSRGAASHGIRALQPVRLRVAFARHLHQRTFADGHKVNAHELTAGVVFKDGNDLDVY